MTPQNLSPQKSPASLMRQFALAMELPFILAGAVIVGGALGFLLDRWWHTKPFLMLIMGGVGFFAGLRDMLRRLQKDDPDSSSNSKS